MTSLQKIIKYGAIAFAIYLSLLIIGIIISAISAVFGITMGLEMFEESTNQASMITKWEQEYSNINSMDIDVSICKLIIQKGDTLKVEVSDVSDQFICKVEGTELKIEDKKLNRNFFNMGDAKPEVIISIPEDKEFREVMIETGVNETKIQYLKADTIKLEMGVGKYQIDKLVAKYASIKAGAGEANIDQAKIEELKLDGGVGKLTVTSKITRRAEVDCGVGKVELDLIGLPENYKVKTNTGLGNFEVNGKKVRNNETIGNGDVGIKVDAGVGETIVNFQSEEKV